MYLLILIKRHQELLNNLINTLEYKNQLEII